ncbi:hypothetical protein GE09DRAFT_215796 [Coniochaeta sp. 2T2.1]|nr:hypothetical protein GE09DRAFT_215796 [Coniochaeta sp. 2T2.1]
MAKMSLVLDKHGDLTLEVGEQRVCFKVCSRAVARASRVFYRMLYGGLHESKPSTEPWIVRLPGEEPIAFRILLAVFHGRTNEVPEDLPNHAKSVGMSKHRLLHDLAVIADKYFLMELLRPWVKLWLKPWREEFLGSFDGKWLGEIITAAWFFGDQELL